MKCHALKAPQVFHKVCVSYFHTSAFRNVLLKAYLKNVSTIIFSYFNMQPKLEFMCVDAGTSYDFIYSFF